MASTKATLETKDTVDNHNLTKDTINMDNKDKWVVNKCQEEIGPNQQETNLTTKDGLKLNLKTNMDNGSKPRFNVNLTINSKTSMESSNYRIKEIITKVTSTITTSRTTTNITITRTTNRCQKETGNILLETFLTKMGGLKLSLKTCKVNGCQLKLQLNHIMLFPIIMDNSNMIKTKVKVKTSITTTTTTTTIITSRTTTNITITRTTNRCQKEPGNNLLETIPTKMVYLELSLKMLTVNGSKLKFNANHTKNLITTMVTSKGSKEIITKVTSTITTNTTITKTITTNKTITKIITTNRCHKVLG